MKSLKKFIFPVFCALTLSSCGLFGDPLPFSLQQAKDRTNELGKTQGFEITMNYNDGEDENGSMLFARKGDTMWFRNQEQGEQAEGGAIIKIQDTYYQFVYNAETEQYDFDKPLEDEDEEAYNNLLDNAQEWLYYGNLLAGTLFKKKGTDTVAGRECLVYEFGLSSVVAMFGAKIKCDIYIDSQIGITLKLDVEGQGQDGEGGEAHIETTSFLTGNQVNVPTLTVPGMTN